MQNPKWQSFLDDKGQHKAPRQYCIAVEECLRRFGRDKYAMGTYAMVSQQDWIAVRIWKKRECYIAMCRYVKGMTSYSKYIAFKWPDFVSRAEMTKTWNVRHRGYSDGSLPLQGLREPEEWTEPNSTPRRHKGRGRANPSPDVVETSPGVEDVSKCWDSEEGEWVHKEE